MYATHNVVAEANSKWPVSLSTDETLSRSSPASRLSV
jgi:hypothetical protein